MTATDSEGKILIACIGNIFLGDDAFGVQVARELWVLGLPEEAVVVDYGIRSFDLAYALLEPWRSIILVDAIARGGAPGSLYLLQPDADTENAVGFNPHAIGPAQVLAMARAIGSVTAPMYIVGCEPQDLGEELDGRIGLSPAVVAAVPRAVAMIERLVEQLTKASAVAGVR
jgi:hydrogenase maturation protease